MTRIDILNNLIQSSNSTKKFFFDWIKERPEVMSKLFYCFIQLMLITVHKTFFDHRWADYKADFIVTRQFF